MSSYLFSSLVFILIVRKEDGPGALVFETLVPSGCFLPFVLFFSVVTRALR